MIALITMLIDHVGAAILEMGFIDGYNHKTLNISYETALRCQSIDMVLRGIGRISFPIYCFLLVEGFVHTRDVKKYAVRLGIFAFLSEIPFDLAFFHSLVDTGHQNVFLTLLLGLLGMMAIEYYKTRPDRWIGAVLAAGCCILGDLLYTDYGAFGVFLILMLYMLRSREWLRALIGCVLTAWEVTAPLAFIPICMYNGERGRLKLKYFFYAIYPAHLLMLYLIWRIYF